MPNWSEIFNPLAERHWNPKKQTKVTEGVFGMGGGGESSSPTPMPQTAQQNPLPAAGDKQSLQQWMQMYIKAKQGQSTTPQL